MKRSGLSTAILCIVCILWVQQLFAQHDVVLMRINGKEILRSEFEYLYNKNRLLTGVEQKTLQEYVDLFVDFKLKVAAAEVAGIDTTTSFRNELDGYRRQLSKNYLTDDAALEREAQRQFAMVKNSPNAVQTKVIHIFKRLPQNASNRLLKKIEHQMDSVYVALQAQKTSFEYCVSQFSDEKSPFWMGRLQMPEEFENSIARLDIGDFSRPFFTPQGIHIVKVLERKTSSLDDVKLEIARRWSRSIDADKRLQSVIGRLKKEYNYTADDEGVAELLSKGSTKRCLFRLDEKEYTGNMFAVFASAHPQGVQRQFDGFVIKSILDYEYNNLEKKYPDFKMLMQEYRDGMLLFEISNREVWERTLADKAGLEAYFAEHQQDYRWETPRYKGIVLHATTKRLGKQVRKFLKSLPPDEWQDAIRLSVNAKEQQVIAEQGIFALGDNAFVDDRIFKVVKTAPLTSHPFTTFLGEKVKGPQSYKEIRGVIVEDYQNHLEQSWLGRLRSAFKVEIYNDVLKTVNNH